MGAIGKVDESMSLRGQKRYTGWKKSRLSREILFWLALTGIFPFFILVLPQYFFAESALVDKEKETLVQALDARAFQVEKWLENIRQDLNFIAESNCSQGHAPHSSPTGNPLYCPFQEAVIRSHGAYRAIQVYSPKGKLLSRSGEAGACCAGPVADRLAAIDAHSAELYVAPEYCFENGATFVTVGKKARVQGGSYEATYILACLNLNQAVDALFTNPFLASGKFYIVSGAGQYLYPPGGDSRLHGGMIRDPKEFLAGRPGEIREYYDVNRELVFGVFRRVSGVDWLLVKEVDKAEVVVPRLTFAKRSALAGIVALLVIFSGSWLVSRRLSKPLDELVAAANSITLGDPNGWRKVPEFPQLEVDQLGRAVNEMQERLRDSEKALVKAASLAAIGEFSAKIVHDIRSPLSSINLALRSLAKSDLEPRDRERLDIAREQAARLMKMADGVLSYGRPLQLSLENFTLGELLQELQVALGADLEEKQLEVRMPADKVLQLGLRADRELLLQALTNLINNAAQWSPRRGLIELEGCQLPGTGRQLWLRIADAGPGFNEKSLAKIFQPFFTTRKKGTGLGLANAKKIIDYHGGSITAANRPSGGAEIVITLPIISRSEDA